MRYIYDRESRKFIPQIQKPMEGVEVRVPRIEPHYNYAFGKIVNNKYDLKDTVKRYNDQHSTQLIEVGNDPPRKNKPPDLSFKGDMREVYYHFNKALKKK